MIDAQRFEGEQVLEAWNHRLCQRGCQTERQLLHLRAVGEESDEGVGHAGGV
ncbi:hypothetical protein TRAPUB_6410 [Trametes pubescens]|uniref:Uncharacterized protein n=1 Tax=Trametes pubescens TaxID=154538 RepID=A0A1M2V697_TRAPU|nr:hypothetical protein TRAPUB_6410 [Trametes pubescens]